MTVEWERLASFEEYLFERLARERGITVKEMSAIISARIEKGWNDLNSKKAHSGEGFPVWEMFQRRKNGCGMRMTKLKKMVTKNCQKYFDNRQFTKKWQKH